MKPYTHQDVRKWAGERSFQRAAPYVKHVRNLKIATEPARMLAEADVQGSRMEPYRVHVGWDGQTLDGTCTCPIGYYCKHAAAVLLAALEQQTKDFSGPDWRQVVRAHRNAPSPGERGSEPERLRFRLAVRPEMAGRGGGEQLMLAASLASAPEFRPVNWYGIASRRGLAPAVRLLGQAIGNLLTYGSRDLPDWMRVPERSVDAVMRLLAEAGPLEDEHGRPVAIRADAPLDATLCYEREGDDGLLRSAVVAADGTPTTLANACVFGDPNPWVWLADGLHPLRGTVLPGNQTSASARIPPGEREEFERRFLPDLVVEGRLTGPGVPARPEVRKVRPIPQLVLEEVGGRLRGRLGFLYGGVRVEADEPSRHVGPPEGPWYARRPGLEKKAIECLPPVPASHRWMLPEPKPVFELAGDAAATFLFDDLERLIEGGFEVIGEDRLAFRPARSTPTTHLTVGSGIDWLDVKAEIRVDDEVLPWPDVWAAIAQKRRYVRLGSGRLARLPADWLKDLAPLFEAVGLRPGAADHAGAVRLPRHQAGLVAKLARTVDAAEADAGWRELANKLATFGGIADVAQPKGFRGELRPYQRKGLAFLTFLRDYGLHGILADDMGLGKTIQAAVLLAANHGKAGTSPSLVVAPTSVIHNWRAELARFAPGLRVLVLHGPQRDVGAIARHDVVITTYATVRLDLEAHQAQAYDTVILDEAQAIKNPRSQTAVAVRTLAARHRLCLTGTPIENNLMELWSQFAFLMPGLLGTEGDFKARYAGPIGWGDNRAADELKARIGPFILRRLKGEVAKDLPPRTDALVWCELPPAQRKLYDTVYLASRARVMAAVAEQGLERSHITILDALLKLRQVCCHPALLGTPETLRLPSAKVEAFMELVNELIASGHRALVFSQFTSMLALLRERLDEARIAYEYLDGATRNRQAKVERFNDGAAPLFLISLKAGGTGLNLTGADYVIHFDPWWNPAVEDQATDRAHRIGQTRHVFSYKLVAKDTIEEKLLALQEKKRALVRDVLEADALGKQLTRADLDVLFGDAPVSSRERPTRRATARTAASTAPVDSPRACLMAQMHAAGFLRNADYRECFGVAPDAAGAALGQLVTRGVLVREGERRGTVYRPGPGWAAWGRR